MLQLDMPEIRDAIDARALVIHAHCPFHLQNVKSTRAVLFRDLTHLVPPASLSVSTWKINEMTLGVAIPVTGNTLTNLIRVQSLIQICLTPSTSTGSTKCGPLRIKSSQSLEKAHADTEHDLDYNVSDNTRLDFSDYDDTYRDRNRGSHQGNYTPCGVCT